MHIVCHVRSLTREIRVRVMRVCHLCVHKKARDSIAVCFLFYFIFCLIHRRTK